MDLKQQDEHKFLDTGKGEVIVLLHGLFGTLSNWDHVTDYFTKRYRVLIPMLPLHTMPKSEATISGITAYFARFVKDLNLDTMHLIGNSLGGHIGLQYTLLAPKKVKSLILTASSGLFERGMGETYPKRNYAYVKERVGFTFYDSNLATKEIINEVHAIVNDLRKCLRFISIAKSAQRENMAQSLPNIKTPTCLIWGLNDTITPPMVAHEFHRLIKNSELHFLDKCCHVPMMEHPVQFNAIVDQFLTKNGGN